VGEEEIGRARDVNKRSTEAVYGTREKSAWDDLTETRVNTFKWLHWFETRPFDIRYKRFRLVDNTPDRDYEKSARPFSARTQWPRHQKTIKFIVISSSAARVTKSVTVRGSRSNTIVLAVVRV